MKTTATTAKFSFKKTTVTVFNKQVSGLKRYTDDDTTTTIINTQQTWIDTTSGFGF
ncbi:hypothetical protein [Hymenobacter aquaticus]|uniref:hypothetical protein n=1 Tax=Hymenobacter aquaticus TaxID=1867101 RepID=UPI0014369555|nr:hypothetical protein [Hymenobacter aquaticus]